MSDASKAAVIATNNLWFGGQDGTVPSWLENGTDINADPKFVDPSSPARDFHLTATGSAINQGHDTPVSRDLEGISRPQGSAYDLGALEWVQVGPPDTESPTAPTGLVANAVSFSQIDLSWTASTDNVAVTGYTVSRSLSGGGPYSEVGLTTSTSYSDTELAEETTYYYVVQAEDAAGNTSGSSNEAVATTPLHVPPETPTNLGVE